jgi:hypothetical protein
MARCSDGRREFFRHVERLDKYDMKLISWFAKLKVEMLNEVEQTNSGTIIKE